MLINNHQMTTQLNMHKMDESVDNAKKITANIYGSGYPDGLTLHSPPSDYLNLAHSL